MKGLVKVVIFLKKERKKWILHKKYLKIVLVNNQRNIQLRRVFQYIHNTKLSILWMIREFGKGNCLYL